MNARAAASGLVCAVALAAFACGGAGEEEQSTQAGAAAPAREAAAASARGAHVDRGANTLASEARVAAPAPGGLEAEDRVGEVLDTDPSGAGLDALIRSVREDADPRVREAAVIALGDSEDPRALDALIAATADNDASVVLAAIDQLSWFDDRLAEDAIRRLVDSPDPEIADAAREELDE